MRAIIWILAAWLMSIALISRLMPIPGIGYIATFLLVPIGSKLRFRHLFFLVSLNFCFVTFLGIDSVIAGVQIAWSSLLNTPHFFNLQLQWDSSLLLTIWIPVYIGGMIYTLLMNAISIKYLSRFRRGLLKKMSKNLECVIREFPNEEK